MRKLLLAVLGLFALLVVNSSYLGAVTFRQWLSGLNLEDRVYQAMFLGHLVLGVAIIAPVLIYGVMHLRRAIHRPNRLAVRLGLVLFGCVIVLLVTGIALTRGLPVIELRDPMFRSVAYWAHIGTPVLVCWLFVLHRLAGRAIRWSVGAGIGVVAVGLGALGIALAETDATDTPETDFAPALARTATGRHIDPEHFMRDDDCATCHPDAHCRLAIQRAPVRVVQQPRVPVLRPEHTPARSSNATATCTRRGSAPAATTRCPCSAGVSTTRISTMSMIRPPTPASAASPATLFVR